MWTRKPALKWTDWFDVNTSGEDTQPSEITILARTVSDLLKRSRFALEYHNISFVDQRPYAIVTVPDFLKTTIQHRPYHGWEPLWPPRNHPSYWNTALFRMMSQAVFDAGFQDIWRTMADGVDPSSMIGQYEASAIWAACATIRYKCFALATGGGETIVEGTYVSRACEEQHNVIISADMTSHSLSFFVRGMEQCQISWSPWSSHTSLSLGQFSNDEQKKAIWIASVQQAIRDLLKGSQPSFDAIANSTLLVKGPGWTDITLQALGDVAQQAGLKLVIPKYPDYVASMAAAAQALGYFDEEWETRTRMAAFTHELRKHDEL